MDAAINCSPVGGQRSRAQSAAGSCKAKAVPSVAKGSQMDGDGFVWSATAGLSLDRRGDHHRGNLRELVPEASRLIATFFRMNFYELLRHDQQSQDLSPFGNDIAYDLPPFRAWV